MPSDTAPPAAAANISPAAAPAAIDGMTRQARLLHAVNRLFAHAYHRTTVHGPPQLPARGPAVLVCNHISGLDPLILQGTIRRVVVWMMAREYYDLPVFNHVFRAIKAIPVDRNGRDMAATRAALRALADGRVLGVFPEGKIETARALLPFQTGVAMLAARAGAPVYPAYLDGSNRGQEMVAACLVPQETRVGYGPPVLPPRLKGQKPNLDIFTEQIQYAVANIKQDMGYV